MKHRDNTTLTLNVLILLVKVLVGKLVVNIFFSNPQRIGNYNDLVESMRKLFHGRTRKRQA